MKRSYDEEREFLTREDGQRFRIDIGFVPNMRVSFDGPSFVLGK